MALNLTIGQYLSVCRRTNGLSQIGMAEALGVSRTTIGRWERDEMEPRPDKIRLLINRKIIDREKMQELLLAGRGRLIDRTVISITLPDRIVDECSVALLHVQNGPFDRLYTSEQPILDLEIPFHIRGSRGEMQAEVRTRTHTGFEFKCFVDHDGLRHAEVCKLLTDYGFHGISAGEGGSRNRRTWFLLRNYRTVTTPEGFENNFCYPS